ncbi:MAG: response regulator transcription factor [Sulfurimonas sp.]|nr:response regulator transcription factor [Sulfurimonas sp.]
MKVLIHSDDINLLSHWEKSIDSKYEIIDNLDELLNMTSSLIIINFSACLPSCDDVLKTLISNDNKVLVLHRTPELAVAKKLLRIGAMGYGNALMRDHFIVAALNAIKDNMVWLYPELTSQLIMDIPTSNDENSDEQLSKLTSREKEVALLLKEAYPYKEIALKLDITPRTVKAHAQSTYSKLNVKDRLALALLLK